jgi:hypothetical protein
MKQSPLRSHWPAICALARASFNSSLHFALATVDADGAPHVTPIGSLLLDPDEPRGMYFEIFTKQMPDNLDRDQRICVLGVNSGKWFWLRALLRGRCDSPPAFRLMGTAGARRLATPTEIARLRKYLSRMRALRGYALLWGDLTAVREIEFESFAPVHLGAMTRGVWKGAGAPVREAKAV